MAVILGVVRVLWKRASRVAIKIGDIQVKIILSCFYFVVLGPFALVVRWATDPLRIRTGASDGWQAKYNAAETEVKRARRQY